MNATPALKPGQISLILATRGRPEMLMEFFQSLGEMTAQKDKTDIWLYVDDDDTVMLDAIAKKIFPDPGLPVHWHIGPQPGGLGQTHQALWKASGRNSQVYVTIVDDARIATRGWDDLVRREYDQYPDGILLAFPHDPNTADQATYPIFGGGWIAALDNIYPGYFPYWFDDKWVDEIARMAGRCTKLPFNVLPIGGKGRTKRMRSHAFWTRFYQITQEERKASARKLIAVMHPQPGAAREAALAQLEVVAKTFTKEKENFSDAYCVFQEERHTEMTWDERLDYQPKHFLHQAKIVARLVADAREFVAQKKFAEAMEFLDCVNLSDIKVRQAHALMADCLRGLGRQAEAEKITSENLAAWPRMNNVRRWFRFLGMVANDGKRMVLGLISKKG
ncbi:MAG: hypothetical protein RL380_10 [Verrucomicrobiota bacterium]|jgi:hypothetical protein